MSQAVQTEARIWLDRPRMEHAREFISAMRDSQGLHHPWVSAPCDPESWRRYLQRLERDNEAGFLVRRLGDNAICGVINLNVITYEALCSAYLSYYAVQKHAGRGYMKEGLQQVIGLAFGEMGLHRLEANIQPGNERSIRLVERLGFECEGYSPRYLMINGKWCDHERWAILADSD
ncbi:MAG TPA: GNAT family protein [Xanthomonadales bacterium]|nr:GNAT family protein [Xanthomonadales bacterium]